MAQQKVGLVGWRGMVGSVLMQRMREGKDFATFEPYFFSTSNAGGDGPDIGLGAQPLGDANSIDELKAMDVILTCQGGDYTGEIFSKLREAGWNGYWIDAASSLRMNDDALLVLDPVNRGVIDAGLEAGVKNLIGANCTVSTMLMGLTGIFQNDLVEWATSMTYQAASGAGARNMEELLKQMHTLGGRVHDTVMDPASTILDVDKKVSEILVDDNFPTENFGVALAGNALPWIDRAVDDGQTREEWKAMVEANKILGTKDEIKIDGTCVRIGSMRSHAQALTIKLKQDVPMDELEEMIAGAHEWVRVVENEKEASITQLTPAAVSGSLNIAVGRLRKMNLGPKYLNVFTVGDQLLWGAAEPLRRALQIVIERS